MAGYFSKLNGRVYEGGYVANADIENGTFAVLSNGKVVASSANTNFEGICVEKTELWGLPALRLRVAKEVGELFFVEGDFDPYEYDEYDETAFVVKAGKYVKMRTPHISDEIILSVSDAIYNAATVGDTYNVAANGAIAKKS